MPFPPGGRGLSDAARKENNELFEKLLETAKTKDVKKMQELLTEFKKKSPKEYMNEIPAYVIRKAVMLLDEGKAREAETELMKVIKIEPENPQAHCVLGYVYSATGEVDKAILHFNKTITNEPKNCTEAHNGMATLFLSLGQVEEAKKHLDQAIEVNPKHVPSYMTYARLFIKEGQNDKAIEYLERAIEQKPETAFPYTVLAERLVESNKRERAVEVLRMGLKKEPYFSSGIATLDLDRYKEAEEPLSQMKEIMDNPDLTKLQPQEQSQGQGSGYDNNSMPIEKRLDGLHKFLVHRAKELSLKHDDWFRAEKLTGLAAILKPEDLETLRFYVMSLWRQNKLDEAESKLRTIVAIHPNDAKIQTMLAAIVSSRGNQAEGQKIAMKAMAEDPNHTQQILAKAFEAEQAQRKKKDDDE